MPILVPCPCGKRIKFPDGAAGKRAKCPACGDVLTAPAEVSAEDDTYDLLDAPPEALQPVAHPGAAATAGGAADAPATPPAGRALSKSLDVNSPFYRAASGRVAARMAEAEKGGKPLFNIVGVDVTPLKLAFTLVLLLVALGIPTWFYTLGPGVNARILSAHTVQTVTLLQGLDTQEPFSLFTGTGNRALGLKGTGSKSTPTSVPVSTALQYTVGGGEELILARPDPAGTQMIVRATISHGLIQSVNRLVNYKVVINADDFALAPAPGSGAGTPILPRLLFAEFEEGVEIDLDGPNAISHESLLPVGVKPSKETLERGHGGGAASGTIRYDGVNGVTGEFRFSSLYYLTGQPAARGLSADGQVTRFTQDGTKVEYKYSYGTLEMTWDQAPHRAAWWSKPTFRAPESFNPWEKVTVTLLFDKPPAPGSDPLELTYCGEPVGTVKPAKAIQLAEAAAKETDERKNRGSAFASGPQDPLTGYFKLLGDARQKARGIVAMSNMNQIGLGLGMYAEANGGRMPESLYDLRSVFPNIDALLVNERTGERPGFVYERPAETFGAIRDPMRTPILWEARQGQKAPGGAVLYADGHVEAGTAP